MPRIVWFCLLLGLGGCREAERLTPHIEEEGEPEGRTAGRPERVDPIQAGAREPSGRLAPSEPELLPEGETGSGFLRLEPRTEQVAVPHVAYSFGTQAEGAHALLRITTRPQGSSGWPWLTLEAWVRTAPALEEWVGREIAVHRFQYMPGPGLAPWPARGRSFLILREALPGRLRVEVDLELLDPIDGTAQRLTGRLLAVEARKP